MGYPKPFSDQSKILLRNDFSSSNMYDETLQRSGSFETTFQAMFVFQIQNTKKVKQIYKIPSRIGKQNIPRWRTDSQSYEMYGCDDILHWMISERMCPRSERLDGALYAR